MAPTLHEEMARATDAARIDTDALVRSARRRGLAIRRRRQALATIGTLGVAGAAAALVVALAPGGTQPTGHDPATPASTGFAPTPTAPFTGRTTAAALEYAVEQVAAGEAAHVQWQDPVGDFPETFATFRFRPADGGDAGEIGINVQPGFTGTAAQDVSRCADWMRHCTVRTGADGSVLVTYEEVSDHDARGIRRVASLLRADHVRVVVSASNGIDVTGREEQVTRDEPVLDAAQLGTIVTQPWWGPQLPASFTGPGARLHGAAIPGTAVAGEPTPAP
jgi:hypothetical protein